MHNWSLIWWKIHSLSLAIQNCILESYYLPKIFSQLLRPVWGTQRGSTWEPGRVWQLVGTARAARPGWQQHTCVPAWCLSGGRLGLLLPQSGWRCAGLAKNAFSIGCLAHARSELLTLLLGWQYLGNLLQSWSSSCWQRQLQGEQDTLYA